MRIADLDMATFESAWWSITPPSGWRAQEDKECATFSHPDGRGVLQISSARKDAGSITVDDLRELAEPELPPAVNLEPVVTGVFDGLHASFSRDHIHWDRWWLRNEQLMIYITYSCPEGMTSLDASAVHRALGTLEPNRGAA